MQERHTGMSLQYFVSLRRVRRGVPQRRDTPSLSEKHKICPEKSGVVVGGQGVRCFEGNAKVKKKKAPLKRGFGKT